MRSTKLRCFQSVWFPAGLLLRWRKKCLPYNSFKTFTLIYEHISQMAYEKMEYLWSKMLRDKYLSSYFSRPFVISNWALSRGKAISTISSTAGLSVDASPFINSLECSLMGRRVGYDLQTSLFPYIKLHTFRFSAMTAACHPLLCFHKELI